MEEIQHATDEDGRTSSPAWPRLLYRLNYISGNEHSEWLELRSESHTRMVVMKGESVLNEKQRATLGIGRGLVNDKRRRGLKCHDYVQKRKHVISCMLIQRMID
jgi:hypothetical protein